MSDLIPTIDFETLKKVVESGRLDEMKSCEVVIGEKPYYFTNPATDYIKLRSEYAGQLSNSVRGLDPEEILTPLFECEACGKSFEQRIALEGHKQSHRVKVSV